MDIDDYEKSWQYLYADFAETMSSIFSDAIAAASLKGSQPHIHDRAKNVERLRARLKEVGQQAADNIEDLRKDLAGCRIVFYTNGDLNEFLQSGILGDNFIIEYDSTRFHHPLSETEPQYRGYNFVVRLKENRAALPEYSRFIGLRCEVQLQTMLNHAWSETSHDIVYKQPEGTQFAKRVMAQIEKRFNDIMQKYLVPAGHEFDKAKHDFDSLMQGRPIFEKGPLRALKEAADNNERRDVLVRIREHYLPNHDDPRPLVPELMETVEEAIIASRGTPPAKIITSWGETDGWAGDDIIDAALDLLKQFRHADAESTLALLMRLMKQAQGDEERQRLLQSVEGLAEVPIAVIRLAGGEIQLRLTRKLMLLDAPDRATLRPLVLKVCEKVLDSSITDTSGSYKTVTFERGAMPASKEIEVARTQAIDILKALYEQSGTDADRLVILNLLSSASATPTIGAYSNDLLAIILKDSLRVVTFMQEAFPDASLELKKAIEVDAWNIFRILCERPFADDNDGLLAALQNELREAALAIRDDLAQDNEYEIFKTLVSLNAVYEPAWSNPRFDYTRDDAWRTERIAAYLDGFTPATEEEWWRRIERCASSRSNDGAGYRGLQELLKRACEEKPNLVLPHLDFFSEEMSRFLPTILAGLWRSSRKSDVEAVLVQWAAEGKHLRSVARHYNIVKEPNFGVLSAVFAAATKGGDELAVTELVDTLVQTYGLPDKSGKPVLLEAIAWLQSQGSTDWIDDVWVSADGLASLASDLTPSERRTVLAAAVSYCNGNHHLDYMLLPFARHDLGSVLDFFGQRLKYASADTRKPRYTAIPWELTEMTPLREAPIVVLDAVLGWMQNDPKVRDHGGPSFVRAAIPEITAELADAMIERANRGDKAMTHGVLAVLAEYDGAEPVFPICREIVAKLDPGDEAPLNAIRFAIEETGTMSGEFGVVEAYSAKKSLLLPWSEDTREAVSQFAKKEIAALERMIAAEQNRAEQAQALYKLNWGEPLD